MPTNRRYKSRRRKPYTFSQERIGQMIHGHVFFFTPEEEQADPREVWAELRDIMLPIWVRHHPGRRPWAWWEYDAPELRKRIIAEGPQPVTLTGNHFRTGQPRRENAFGRPTAYDGWFAGLDLLYESTPDYLERLGLMLPGEAEAIAAAPSRDELEPCDRSESRHSAEFMAELMETISNRN